MKLFDFLFKKNKSSDKTRKESFHSGSEILAKAQRYLEKNEFSEALPLLDKAIELGQIEGYYDRGLCLQALGFNLDSIDDFTKAIAMTPTDCNLYFCRGNSKINLNLFDSAIEDGEKALQLAELGLEENKKYEIAAIAQGRSSASSLYSNMIWNWKLLEESPEIKKIFQNEYQYRLKRALPEDIYWIKEEQRKKDELLKRRIK